jgi:hypothetical protein
MLEARPDGSRNGAHRRDPRNLIPRAVRSSGGGRTADAPPAPVRLAQLGDWTVCTYACICGGCLGGSAGCWSWLEPGVL